MDATPSAEHWTYSNDALDRLLTSANSSDTSSSRSFSYNDAGSVTSNSAIGTYTYPVQWAGAQRPHSPLSINGATLGYDANGNRTSGLGKTLTYDGDNRPVSVIQTGSTTTYAYGPDGSRIKTVATVGTDPAKTSYLLGSSELDDAGVLTKIPNSDIRKVGTTECFVHRDHLASVKLETDVSGAIAMRQLLFKLCGNFLCGRRRRATSRLPASNHHLQQLSPMEAAADYGFKEGSVIPFHYADKLGRVHSSLCSLIWKDRVPDLWIVTEQSFQELHLILIYWMQRSIDLREAARKPNADSVVRFHTEGLEIGLTHRERDVLAWTALGKTADILGISPRTVEAHIKSAIEKLGAGNRTHAVAKAILLQLIDV